MAGPASAISLDGIAPGKFIGSNRPPDCSGGVLPPWPNQACATTTVRPAAKKFIATPEII